MFRLLLAASVLALAAAQCSYNGNGISAKWQVSNGELVVQLKNTNIGNNQWTGIGFGESMSDLEVVIFTIENNRARTATGYTDGYGAPKLDSSPNVAPEQIAYNSNQLTARFVRPLGANGPRQSNLSQCMTWNFIAMGEIEYGDLGYHRSGPFSVEVCPEDC